MRNVGIQQINIYMSDLGFILLIVLVALFVAWFANFLLSLIRGEHSRDTGRVWWDLMDLDFLEGVFKNITGSRVRLIFVLIGFVALLVFLLKVVIGD
jgi:hypothetical protein